MSRLSSDSPLSRRIVLSFLQFLNSVEPAPGVDLEGLEVAKECLGNIFNIESSSSSVDSESNTDSLIKIFELLEASGQRETNPNVSQARFSPDAPGTSSSPNAVKTDEIGGVVSKDELFGQFFGALENIRYFKSLPDGSDDQAQLDRASQAFHSALEDMTKSGCETLNRKTLAETLKSQGNKAMQSKLYAVSIELYTFAIALSQDNAVYYCNRAAAHTQIHEYAEAVKDCLKAIEIDPNYSKAYSRLGFAYFAQGKYRDAIDKGFKKALQLDPNNTSVRENIRVAEQKLVEEQLWAGLGHGHGQSSSSGSYQTEVNHHTRTSTPFNVNGLPPDIASMLMNMGANVHQGTHFQAGAGVDINTDAPNNAPNGAGVRLGGGNINVNFGEQMPDELSGALRSVMEIFTGGGPVTPPHSSPPPPPPPPPHGEDDTSSGPSTN